MAEMNIEKLSLSSKNREKEEQKKLLRRKSLLILIHNYLEEYGFIQAADVLKSESSFPIDEFSVCDNIHLETILQDFETYHFIKYQKLPQLVKKICDAERKVNSNGKFQRCLKKESLTSYVPQSFNRELKKQRSKNVIHKSFDNEDNPKDIYENQLNTVDKNFLKPLGPFENYNNEWKFLAESIMQDVVRNDCSVSWNDVVGHERAKEILKEAIVYPIKYAQLFPSVAMSWKGLLLYGPTGTGKTLLAKVASSECQTTFFNICASSILSKWRGESEKLVKVLFDLAKYYAPSTIFVDEIDSLVSHRGSDHEASRRLKTEFFLQMDSLSSSDKLVFVLAATNIPWELDHAMLRRLEKRILISLPDKEQRVSLFKKFLPPVIENESSVALKAELNYEELGENTDNYSSADIELVCKEAKMCSIRQAFKILESSAGKRMSQAFILKPLKNGDVLQAIHMTKPAGGEFLENYTEWEAKHGST